MSKPWYKQNWLVIAALILLPPVGIGLAWFSDWPRKNKWASTGLGLFWWLLVSVSDSSTSTSEDVIADQPEETQSATDEAPAPEPAAEEAATEDPDTTSLYTVTRIYDGDTIDAFRDGTTIKVRLACIDAPETDQPPHGQAATDRLSSLVPGQVMLNIVDEDRYGRSVAEVYTPEGAFLNLQMLESGNAVVYTEYLAK